MARPTLFRLSALSALLAGGALQAQGLQRPAPAALYMIQSRQQARAAAGLAWLDGRKAMLGLGGDDSFRVRSVRTDEFGETHLRVEQHFRGLRVWGAEGIVHLDAEGNPLPLTHHFQRQVALASTTPTVDETTILRFVKNDLRPKGDWLPPTVELVVINNPGPAMPAVVRDPGTKKWRLDYSRAAFHAPMSTDPQILAYYVHTALENDKDGIRHTDYLVEADSGLILRKWDSLQTDAPAKGTANTQYNGVVSLDTTDSTATLGGFQLLDQTRPTLPHPLTGVLGNATTNLHNQNPNRFMPPRGFFNAGDPFVDADNAWGDGLNFTFDPNVDLSATDNGQTAAADAHFGMAATWDFYGQVLGRNGIDGLGTSTVSRAHMLPYFYNAFWDTDTFSMSYGDGGHYLKSFTCLDVVGHELSHGVMATTADLVYADEMGGLNESNSDILGTMVEFYTRGGKGDGVIPDTGGNWTMGEQLSTPSSPDPLRWMDTPSRDGMSYDAWFQGIGLDDPHFVSGPNNRMFYYLSQGAPTAGPAQSAYVPGGFPGIGNDKAARIWYRTIATYLTSFSSYHDTRDGAIQSATDLYGAASPEVAAVENAFAAINVGAAHGQAPRPEVHIDANSPWFNLANGPFMPGLLGFVTSGETSANPLFQVQVLNTANQAVIWGAPAGGQMSADGRFTAPKRLGGIYPVTVTSQADSLEHSQGLVFSVDLDADDDTVVDAADLGPIALAYGSYLDTSNPNSTFNQKADIDFDLFISDFDILAFTEAFDKLYAH